MTVERGGLVIKEEVERPRYRRHINMHEGALQLDF